MTPEKILRLARAELGVKESPKGSNNVKYNTAYYGQEVSGPGYAWCCVFLWWLFREAGASALFFNGKKTAYCPALLTYHRHMGQEVKGDYRPGDIVFFDFNGNGTADHVGLCEDFDGTYIITIDGNTGNDSEANGGCVMRRKRHKKYICGAVRPAYGEVEELTEEQIRAIVRDEMSKQAAAQAALPASKWAKELLAKAVANGITDGTRPQSYATRQEVAVMVVNAINRK